MVRQRVRIRFSKTGDLRTISHRDLVRTFERLFRRAELNLSMTQGFHSRPRMTYPSALAVGIAGENEVMELELDEVCHPHELLERLRRNAVAGLEILEVESLPPGTKNARFTAHTFTITVPEDRSTQTGDSIAGFLDRESFVVQREDGKRPRDIRPLVRDLQMDGQILSMQLHILQDGSARPREVLAALGLADIEEEGHHLTRSVVEFAS